MTLASIRVDKSGMGQRKKFSLLLQEVFKSWTRAKQTEDEYFILKLKTRIFPHKKKKKKICKNPSSNQGGPISEKSSI